MNLSELTDQILRLTNRLEDLEKANRDLGSRVSQLEGLGVEHRVAMPVVRILDVAKAKTLFWMCTPRQHAMIQLVLSGFSNLEIADRLDSTVPSIKTRFRHLCGRLSIKGRAELEANFKSLLEAADDEEYQSSTRIPKNWAVEYGKLTFKQAKKKDPYFKDICETNYRGATMS